MNDSPTNEEHWHLKKEVPTATVMALAVSLVTLAGWIVSIRTDVDLHYQEFNTHVKQQASDEQRHDAVDKEILSELKSIRGALTKFMIEQAERQGGK